MEYTTLISGKSQSLTKTAFYLLRFNVALQIALAAISINLFLAIATFFYGWNSLYCAFGADSIIGVLTAMILVWRFASSKNETINETGSNIRKLSENYNHDDVHPFLRSLPSTIEDTPDDNRRELWSTFWLGQIMIVSGFGVVIRSIIELVHHIIHNVHTNEPHVQRILAEDSVVPPFEPEQTFQYMHPLYILALISLAMNIVLMGFKLFIYYHLESNSMLIEGINSFISAIFAVTTIVSIQFHDRVEYLDQSVSIMFGVFLISYGLYNVLHTLAHTVIDLIKQKCNQHRQQRQNRKQEEDEEKCSLEKVHHHHHHHQKGQKKKIYHSFNKCDYVRLV